jgi:hypothetical protein
MKTLKAKRAAFAAYDDYINGDYAAAHSPNYEERWAANELINPEEELFLMMSGEHSAEEWDSLRDCWQKKADAYRRSK